MIDERFRIAPFVLRQIIRHQIFVVAFPIVSVALLLRLIVVHLVVVLLLLILVLRLILRLRALI